MQSKDAIRFIKQRLNIVDVVRRYVELKHSSGSRWSAPCPFHQETKPSFSVNEEEGLFYCFGCQAKGDIFEFYGRINGLDFKETLEQLAFEVGIQIDPWRGNNGQNTGNSQNLRKAQSNKQNILRMYALAEAHFVTNLKGSDGKLCQQYIEGRKLSPEIISAFSLGWAKKDWQDLSNKLRGAGFTEKEAIESGLLARSEKTGRAYDRFRGRLIFPIRSLGNQVIAFGGRIIGDEDEAKYINSSDSPIYKKGDNLYGLAQARKSITVKGKALLTEGYMDVLTLHQFGYANAVGVLGTSLTPEQVKRLSGFTSQLTLLFDGDAPGRKAALRSSEMLLSRGLSCKVVLLPEGEDIDSLLHKEGTEAFEQLQNCAPDGLDFCIQTLRQMAPREAVDWARNFLQKIEIQELISPYTSRLATSLQLSEQSLRQSAQQARQKKHSAGQAQRDTAATAYDPQGSKGAYGKNTGPQGNPLTLNAMRDKQIMMYAVRYPHRLHDLQYHGADVALSTDVAKDLWRKIEIFAPEEVFYQLNTREKDFWVMCRAGEAPPIDQENNGEKELQSLLKELDMLAKKSQKSSLSAALRENARTGDFEADLDYLRVLQETLGRPDE